MELISSLTLKKVEVSSDSGDSREMRGRVLE